MAKEFVFTVDDTAVLDALAGIKNGRARALTRAINRTLITVRAEAARAVAQDTGLKVTAVKKAMKIANATFSTLTGGVLVTGKRIPLIEFGAKGPRPSRGRRGSAVTASTGPGRSRQSYPGAFIATVKAGTRGEIHEGIFVRRLPSLRRSVGSRGFNLPIKQLFGPSLPKVAANAAVVAAVRAVADEALQKNLDHEVKFLLERKGA